MASIGGSVEAPRDLDVLLEGRAADIGEEARLAEIKLGQDRAHHVLDARILQADGVQHAGGSSYTRCGVLPSRGLPVVP